MRRAVGFRNVSVHAYQSLDRAIVHSIATRRLGDFVEFGKAVEVLLSPAAPGDR